MSRGARPKPFLQIWCFPQTNARLARADQVAPLPCRPSSLPVYVPATAAQQQQQALMRPENAQDQVGVRVHLLQGTCRPSSRQMSSSHLCAPTQYLASRAEALQSVERTIAELGGIFQHLAELVRPAPHLSSDPLVTPMWSGIAALT